MRHNQSGITLIEIIIGLTLTALAGFLVVGLLTSSGRLFMDQSIQVNHGLSTNQAKQEIADLIKSSAGVAAQYPAVGAAQFTTGSQVLVVKLPAISQSGQVIESVFDYGVVTKSPVGSKLLKKKIYPDPLSSRKSEDKVLSTSLNSLSFNYLDSNNNAVSPLQSVRITFIISLSDQGSLGDNENSSSSTVNLKNL